MQVACIVLSNQTQWTPSGASQGSDVSTKVLHDMPIFRDHCHQDIRLCRHGFFSVRITSNILGIVWTSSKLSETSLTNALSVMSQEVHSQEFMLWRPNHEKGITLYRNEVRTTQGWIPTNIQSYYKPIPSCPFWSIIMSRWAYVQCHGPSG